MRQRYHFEKYALAEVREFRGLTAPEVDRMRQAACQWAKRHIYPRHIRVQRINSNLTTVTRTL